ncbi:MAG: phosphoribosylglycinamide formyltransferase [Xanthomonadaceae bacterium]|nr:phosphoribosylglycinamide formyltransferase [Xanthomonadaceae bacterium]
MVKVGILASGRGSNFEAILRAVNAKKLNLEIVLVASNKENAPVLEKAKQANIPIYAGQDYALALHNHGVEFVILAGFMKILSASFIAAYKSKKGDYSKIVNVHPSLLPAFTGLNGYEQAFNYGSKVAGVTIHLVDEKLDHGPVCAQKSFSIEGCKTPSDVEKIGLAIEHELYPETLSWVINENFVIEGRRCVRTS